MTRHPGRRLLAWLVDCALVLAYAAVLAAIGVPLYLAGVLRDTTFLLANVGSALVLVVPVVLVLAGLESGRRSATVGKRVLRLRVVTAPDGARVPYARAVARNALKVALPWLIGHAAVYGLSGTASADATVPGWIWPLLGLSYAIPLLWVVSLFPGRGRTPYDRVSRTQVVAVDPTAGGLDASQVGVRHPAP